ncbi:MAG TPA: hypothetical protein VJH55_02445 [Candidatus Paceibacterota bacterium]|uniref:Uncharacterized protein n=1 Tax=Candidatus Zambryskibacteria bacterium RIFCSPHIGHO2_01_FULL_49_18 TaxID=1802740 RepID=A0A1G2T5X7_9BACT|nr:MAG: hypothetical protein A2758_03240 [Candidatus Zambryskibacteria bacterium RIFCSPHIGHO2_01_FULL_49_18]
MALSSTRAKKERLKKEVLLLTLSVLAAVFLAQTSLLNDLLSKTYELKLFGSFVAGIFFTSVFTIAPAAVALAEIAQNNSLWVVALVGAVGAVLGDLILFLFLEDHVERDFLSLLNTSKRKKIFALLNLPVFRRLTPVLGALIIASPLPDELGLAMMGLSKTKLRVIIPISFCMNFLGIMLLGLVARTVV